MSSGILPKEESEIIISDDLALILVAANVIDSNIIGTRIEVDEEDNYETGKQDVKIVGTYSSNHYAPYSFIDNYNMDLSLDTLEYAQKVNYEIYDEDYNRANINLCGLDTCAENYSYEKYLETGIVGTMIPDETAYANTTVKNTMYITVDESDNRGQIEELLKQIYPYADIIDNESDINDFKPLTLRIYLSIVLLLVINLVIIKKS